MENINDKINKNNCMEMKYKVGNRVQIKSIAWYNEYKDKDGTVKLLESSNSKFNFVKPMAPLCGKVVTIGYVNRNYYNILEDNGDYAWTDEMIEGLVEEEIITTNTTNGLQFKELNISLENEMEWNLPQGYQFKDENGNIINATKIVLEKKKKEYPKTYEECYKVLGCKANHFFTNFSYNGLDIEISSYEYKIDDLLQNFRKLRYCRDAYWKIAGEEMCLGKPWEPKHAYDEEIFFIYCDRANGIKKGQGFPTDNFCLVFPTEEMRDVFYENFKKEIEQCKELL